ncbi:hypothetical protein [Corallococcus llansteffanensis]|uniref:Lipoprotein n=1 Tax=Corallococcus llansteffanensis TaxID=2316731 RepID=A0A3A8N013_9BACT|nr:hypothetical protein [Corallococcus llansteffanensis]RKH37606.1 hypothetical protein D7V93_41905 [Corallococcus llansteffanensis]
MRLSRLLPLCLALGGCALEPDDPIYLSGTVLEADGTPWRGGPLTLMRPRNTDPQPDGYGGVTGTPRYEPWAEVVPDAEGLFLHRLTAREVGADGLEHPHPWTDVTAFQLHLPRTDGGRDFLSFQVDLDADLPPLRAWNGQVHAVEERGGARLTWDAVVPTADLPEPEYFVRVQGEAGLAWQVHAGSAEPWLGPWMLEDFDVQTRVQAVSKGTRVWFKNTLFYSAVGESPPVPLPFTGQVPASRGAGCALASGSFEPCPLTDGKLERFRVSNEQEALPKAVYLVLKEPVRPQRVLVRGLTGFGDVLHVEGSVDGETWVPMGDSPIILELNKVPYEEDVAVRSGDEQYLDVPLRADAPAVGRIRLRMTNVLSDGTAAEGQFSSLREVSVFGGPGID